jgi:aspartyl-tRNA(Asn)/glutamyl-tRNA(Gln) amidotransferase subunit C
MDVQYVAHLARLELTPEEQARFGAQLGEVLAYFEQLEQVDVTGAEPLAHAIPLANVARSDSVRESLPHEQALHNAPTQANGLFLVPKIVE